MGRHVAACLMAMVAGAGAAAIFGGLGTVSARAESVTYNFFAGGPNGDGFLAFDPALGTLTSVHFVATGMIHADYSIMNPQQFPATPYTYSGNATITIATGVTKIEMFTRGVTGDGTLKANQSSLNLSASFTIDATRSGTPGQLAAFIVPPAGSSGGTSSFIFGSGSLVPTLPGFQLAWIQPPKDTGLSATGTVTYTYIAADAAPEPASWIMLGAGAIGIAAAARRR